MKTKIQITVGAYSLSYLNKDKSIFFSIYFLCFSNNLATKFINSFALCYLPFNITESTGISKSFGKWITLNLKFSYLKEINKL